MKQPISSLLFSFLLHFHTDPCSSVSAALVKMSGKYVSGGILAALHKTSTPETTEQKSPETVEKNENGEQNVLASLFTVDKKGHDSEEEEEELTEDVALANEFESTLVEKVKAANDDDSEDETNKPAMKQKKTKIEESPERLERTLFVGNVALTVTKKTLRKGQWIL